MFYLACAPEVDGVSGRYFANRKARQSSKASYDIAAQARWWAETLDFQIVYEDDHEVAVIPKHMSEDVIEDGATFVKTYPVFANSRRTIGIGLDEAMGGFGAVMSGRRFGCVIESLPASEGGVPPELVVERAMYSNSEGVYWAAGHNSVATKLP